MNLVGNGNKPRKGRPKPGDLGALRRLLWGGLLEAEALSKGGDDNTRLRALATMGTLGGTYIKTVEAHDLERRLEALENLAVGRSA